MMNAKLTPFGKQVRRYRIDIGVSLGEMANAMGVSSSYLSSLEVGRKPLNESMVKSITQFFLHKGVNADELIALADRTRATVKVDSLDDFSREMVATFARRVHKLSDGDKLRLSTELEKFFKDEEK